MFLAYTKKGQILIEGSDNNGKPFTWDDIPMDTRITAVSMTRPNSYVNEKTPAKISINKYHYYYFFNEATVSVIRSSNEGDKINATLVAKVMAGIDVEKGYVLEVRLDRFGNASVSHYPLEILLAKINSKQMRKSILRTGIDCADDKKLL